MAYSKEKLTNLQEKSIELDRKKAVAEELKVGSATEGKEPSLLGSFKEKVERKKILRDISVNEDLISKQFSDAQEEAQEINKKLGEYTELVLSDLLELKAYLGIDGERLNQLHN